MRVFNPEVFNESIRQCAENVYSDSLIIKGDDLEVEMLNDWPQIGDVS